MNILRASVAVALALSTSLAGAQDAPSIAERLQQLEAQQAEIARQMQELKRELAAQQGQAPSAAPSPAAPPPTASGTASPAGSGAAPPAPSPPAQQLPAGGAPVVMPERETPTPRLETWGVYDPGDGFLVGRNDYGELSLSTYAMARYMNQNDEDQVFTDHLGNVRPVDPRNDIFSHRIMVFVKGWVGDPKLIYNVFVWTVNTTDQDAIFGNLGYQFSKKFSLYVGVAGNPGSRSLLGSHPYWLGHDRVMADEFFRPFFGSGIWASGEALPGLVYDVMVSNNSSALGITASQLDRKMTVGGSVWWMPTTHEFGPRGGYGDWEWHEELATRFGVSYVDSPEQSFRDSSNNPENTTLRLADSVNLFETGALAPGVTIENADYEIVAIDAGMKYKGVFLQAEYYQRTLDNFAANGLLPVRQIKDTGFYVQGSFFPIKRKLELYALTSQIYGDDDAGFGDSSEYGVGMNWYPWPTRNHRLNVQALDINRSPVSSTFGYYTGGLDGWTYATSFSIFF